MEYIYILVLNRLRLIDIYIPVAAATPAPPFIIATFTILATLAIPAAPAILF